MSNPNVSQAMPVPPNSTAIYLADDAGATAGPFTATEFASMRETGRLNGYQWMWDGQSPDWKPLHRPMPPVPGVPTAARATPAPAAPASRPRKAAAEVKQELEPISATCYNHHCMVSGKLARVGSDGCEVALLEGHHPSFAPEGMLYLNLLDTASGRSMTVAAQLSRIFRRDGTWALKLSWQDCPELLQA